MGGSLSEQESLCGGNGTTHILLLFVDVSNLEPDVDFGERSRRILQNISETLYITRSVLRDCH